MNGTMTQTGDGDVADDDFVVDDTIRSPRHTAREVGRQMQIALCSPPRAALSRQGRLLVSTTELALPRTLRSPTHRAAGVAVVE